MWNLKAKCKRYTQWGTKNKHPKTRLVLGRIRHLGQDSPSSTIAVFSTSRVFHLKSDSKSSYKPKYGSKYPNNPLKIIHAI